MAKKQTVVVEKPRKGKKSGLASPQPGAGSESEGNKPQRGMVIGDNFGWTGKLPATLLFEFAQKQKWNKVSIEMKKVATGFVGIVDLSYNDPKSRETIHIRMQPDLALLPPRDTTNEARHFAATYAMFRLNYNKNIQMVLPLTFRSYWGELQARRLIELKQNKAAHDRFYNNDPFTVLLKEKEHQMQKLKSSEQAKKDLSVRPIVSLQQAPPKEVKRTSGSTFPPKAWGQAPFVDFDSGLRSSIERMIRNRIKWASEDRHALDGVDLENQIVRLGFRRSQAKEALTYTSTFVDTLEWLLFHLPEDDLPHFFSKRDEDSAVSLKISKDAKTEGILKRLKESGVDEDTVVETYNSLGDEISAAVALTHDILSFQGSSDRLEGSYETWTQELEGLEMVGSKAILLEREGRIATIPLEVPQIARDLLSVRLYYVSSYPESLPGVHIIVNDRSFKLASYIKLSIVKQLLNFVLANGLLGSCFLFDIVEWLEQNASKIIDDPGPLVSTQNAPVKREGTQSSTHSKARRGKPKQDRFAKHDIGQLRSIYLDVKSSAAWKRQEHSRSKLPAWKMKEQLANTITANRVTLITGETGSGKSTQLVQFVLDSINAQGNFNGTIICTQPRRILTISLAERIAEERVLSVGEEIGYIIRGENRTLPLTRILFVTTGVLLRMIQSTLTSEKERSLFDRLEFVYVDEVHERSVDSDFLLILLKRIMNRYSKLKIVLMSATIDTQIFKNFFPGNVNHLHIEGRTFPIEDHYLEDIFGSINFTVKSDARVLQPSSNSSFFKRGEINYELVAQLCKNVDKRLSNEGINGSILVFLPGVLEIKKCIRAIETESQDSEFECFCLPLHSTLTSNEQKKVFHPSPRGKRKIIVSTNIAETSITIPDCVVVVDAGRSKSVVYDAKANTTKLVEGWCSKAEMAQRRGRAGRVREGICFHLYTRDTESLVSPQPIPEIRRTSLNNLYLVVKAMGIEDASEFLNGGLDKPEKQLLDMARKTLEEIGATSLLTGREELTNLGKYLSLLPCDLHCGKLLIFGCVFGCVDTCLTLASLVSSGNLFISDFKLQEEIRRVKQAFGQNQGDLLSSVNVYNSYRKLRGKERRSFQLDHYLSYQALQDIETNRAQYLLILKEIGFVPQNINQSILNRNEDNLALIRAIICSAYSPKIARVQPPNTKYAQTLTGAVELEADERKAKFWIRNEAFVDQARQGLKPETLPATRAFLHPSSSFFQLQTLSANSESVHFEDGPTKTENLSSNALPMATTFNNFSRQPFIAYTSSFLTSKLYIKEATPVGALAVLLLGGGIQYDIGDFANSGRKCPGITLDDWIPIRTWCKNGVLIKKLRLLLDEAIGNLLSAPDYSQTLADDANFELINLVTKVLTDSST